MDELRLRIRKVGDACVVSFTGNFDFDMDNLTEDYVENLLHTQSKILVLDMSKIRKVASAFINRLVKILRTVENDKGKLFLVNVPDQVIKILSMVNIIGRFHVYHSEEELKSVHGSDVSTGTSGPAAPAVFSFKKTPEGYHHTYRLTGSFVEGAPTATLLDDIKASIVQGARSISLDFEQVEVLDTISVGLLLMLQKICEEKKIPIKITNPNAIAAHVLDMNEVGRLFGL